MKLALVVLKLYVAVTLLLILAVVLMQMAFDTMRARRGRVF